MTANLTSNVGPGAWIGAEGRFGPVSMGLEIRGVFPATVQFDKYQLDLSQLVLHLVPCGRYSYFFGCTVVGLGAEIYNDANFLKPGQSPLEAGFVWQFGGRLGAEVPFGETGLAGRAWGEVVYATPKSGPVYHLPGADVTWSRPDVSAFFGLGLVLKLGNEVAK